MHDLELRAQDAGLAGLVNGAKCAFPKPAAGRQERVVGNKSGLVGSFRFEPGPTEVAVNFAADLLKGLLDCIDRVGHFSQYDLSDDGLHVGVGERDADGKAVGELLKRRVGGQRCLAGRNNKDLGAESRRAAFYEVLNVQGFGVVVVDVLLHLVKHNQREWKLVVSCALQFEDLLEGIEHFVVADVIDDRVLALQGGADRGWCVAERGAGLDE